jgi:hypothetical protein
MLSPIPRATRNRAGLFAGSGMEFKVEIALGTGSGSEGIWAPDPNEGEWDQSLWSDTEGPGTLYWVDVTGRALSVVTSSGRDRFESRFRTGSATFVLDNDDGVFSPDHGSIGDVRFRPGRWIRLTGRLSNSGDDFTPLWTGYITSITDDYGPAGGSIRSRLTAQDHLGNLQIDNPPALDSPVPSELSSERVDRILDLTGWPPEARISDVGFFDVQGSELAQSRLEEIQLTAESEGGAFYQAKDGRTVFRNRDYLESPRSANVQFSIGQIGSGVQVLSAQSDWSTARVYNDVTFARSGGNAQRVEDDTSISMYQRRTNGRNNLQNTNDADVLFLAQRFLENFRYDKIRIEQLTVTATTDAGVANLLHAELADRVQVTIRNLRGWAFTIDAWINRITWRVTADDWEVDLTVDNTDISDPIGRTGFAEDGFDAGFGV